MRLDEHWRKAIQGHIVCGLEAGSIGLVDDHRNEVGMKLALAINDVIAAMRKVRELKARREASYLRVVYE